jgi:hypothetical protein
MENTIWNTWIISNSSENWCIIEPQVGCINLSSIGIRCLWMPAMRTLT